MDNEPDHYEILGVKRTASMEEVHDQYATRRLALEELLQTYPDRKEQISKELAAVEAAYSILGISKNRAEYFKRGKLAERKNEEKIGRWVSYAIGVLLGWASIVFLYQWATYGYDGAKRINKFGPLALPFAAFWIWLWFLKHFEEKGDKDGVKFVIGIGIIALIVTIIATVAPRPSLPDCEVGRAGYVCR